MPLNIAEGEAAGETRAAAYGRREDPQDSNRIFEIARGSALQRSSIRDARRVCDATDDASDRRGKSDCKRIVPLLTRLIQRTETASAARIAYESEYEYRDAEHEYEANPET